ncbi:MAG TPA: gluconate 2-dehydrogenase subunit 3 family protein [Cyclobacteriaceae bacterium]|nr:gluconate 2-dehydrogenase subunit 3 family protein [Cyclobacteriaceae bacterium]
MNTLIDRREALRKTALVMGAAVSSSTIIAFLQGCKNAPALNYKPVFFNEDQARLISEVAEIILPKTDTPGAKDVGVPNFIDMLINDCYKPEDQKEFVDGLAKFDEEAKKSSGDSFIYLDSDKQKEYVKKVHAEAVEARKKDHEAPRPFILKLKELTMLGFFTSEPGATQVLQYNQVPGAYHGCIPLSEAGNGKTWA